MYQSTWCTVEDIMSDLRVPRGGSGGRGGGRRGCGLRGRLDRNYLVVGEGPPPTLQGTEETEEEYISNGSTADPLPPDLSLIQQMLQVVSEGEVVSNDRVEQLNDILVITKMNAIPLGPKLPQADVKKKICRNVALTSLLLKLSNNNAKSESSGSSKLLTPQDIVGRPSCAVTSGQAARTNEKEAPSEDITLPLKKCILNPTNMFKRKTKPVTPEKKVVSSETAPVLSPTYVPSAFAKEKYEEFMERNSQKGKLAAVNPLEEAYQEMKERDALSIQPDINQHPGLTDEEFKRLKAVLLRAHRHQLSDDCKVCLVKSKNQYPCDSDYST